MYTGDCASLQVRIAERDGSRACIGDNITFTCRVAAIVHDWSIPSLGFSQLISRSRRSNDDSTYRISTVADDGNSIITELSFVAVNSINATRIVCIDGNTENGESEEAIVEVFGKSNIIM